MARGQRPNDAPPKTLRRPSIGGAIPYGSFSELDRTLEPRSELVYQAIDVLEPFDGQRNSTVRPGAHLEDEKILFVRRSEYSVVSVETRLAWLPAAYPLRKECYTLDRDEEGVVSVAVPDATARCRLSTVSPETGVALR